MGTLRRTTELASAFDTATLDERVALDTLTAGFPLYLSTSQLKHSLRMSVGDALRLPGLPEGRSVKLWTDEDICLAGRELVGVQFCLDAVLQNHKFVTCYSISPQAHHSEGMSMGSDHRQTIALSLTTQISRWRRINLSGHPGTHLTDNWTPEQFNSLSESIGQSRTPGHIGSADENIGRSSACLLLSGGIRGPSTAVLDREGNMRTILGPPALRFRELTRMLKSAENMDSPLGESPDIIVSELANPCKPNRQRILWAVVEIVSSWMQSEGRKQ